MIAPGQMTIEELLRKLAQGVPGFDGPMVRFTVDDEGAITDIEWLVEPLEPKRMQ